MAKKLAFPKIKFHNSGQKTDGGGLGFGWELEYYHFLQRWNGGVPTPNCFKTKTFNDEFTVAAVKRFYGVHNEKASPHDLRQVVYQTWNDLPRGSIPIAEIEIEDTEWDLCILLTFTWTERINKIYMLANPHDCGPFDPDDLSELILVANSLPTFLNSLKPREYFCYRSWYELPVPASELQPVANLLMSNGVEDLWGHLTSVPERHCSLGRHPTDNYSVWLARPNTSIRDIGPPKKINSEHSILAIDTYRWVQADAEKSIKTALKSLGLGRKLKKIGESGLAKKPGPFAPSRIK